MESFLLRLILICALVNIVMAQTSYLDGESSCRSAEITARVPSANIGNSGPWIFSGPATSLYVSPAKKAESYCCKRGYIVKWKIYPTEDYGWVGSLGAKCSDDEELPSIRYGYNGSYPCRAGFRLPVEVQNPEDGNYSYQVGFAIEGFIETNKVSASQTEYTKCPNGSVAIGFSARSQCLSLVEARILCGKSRASKAAQLANIDSENHSTQTPNYSFGLIISWMVVGGISFNLIIILGLYAYRKIRRSKQVTCPERDSGFSTLCMHSQSSFDSPLGPGPPATEIPFFEGLECVDDFDFLDITVLSLSRSKSSVQQDLPSQFLTWRISPSNLTMLTPNGRPIILGQGGFGRVLLANYCGTPVAVKILKGASPERQALLLHEISILERCRFHRIVAFYGFSLFRDKLVLVMEYMDNGTLYERICMGDPSMQWYKKGKDVMYSVAVGLNFLHTNSICHLDLKSPNVLLSRTGQAKISDLGLGRLIANAKGYVSAPRSESPPWKAPEIEQGKCCLATDIYSFGVMIWEVCRMQRPRIGNLSEIECPKEAPQSVSEMSLRCRAHDPKARPSISEIRDWFKTL